MPCRKSNPAAMMRSSEDPSSASGLRTTAASRACENSRPIAAPISHLLGWAKSVEPRHKGCVQTWWDGHKGRRMRGGSSLCFVRSLRLQDGLCHLFHK
jgi:hypothetical protein